MSENASTQYVPCERVTAAGLDPIHVFWLNDRPNGGTVVIQCYDQAWTATWSATGTHRIEPFFLSCDVDYILSKLTGSRRVTKKEEAYLGRIVTAVQQALRAKAAA